MRLRWSVRKGDQKFITVWADSCDIADGVLIFRDQVNDGMPIVAAFAPANWTYVEQVSEK